MAAPAIGTKLTLVPNRPVVMASHSGWSVSLSM